MTDFTPELMGIKFGFKDKVEALMDDLSYEEINKCITDLTKPPKPPIQLKYPYIFIDQEGNSHLVTSPTESQSQPSQLNQNPEPE
jgi:hypothetical protein